MAETYQINIRIDKEIRDWLDLQPRSFSLSAAIRSFLHTVMVKQGDTNHEKHN